MRRRKKRKLLFLFVIFAVCIVWFGKQSGGKEIHTSAEAEKVYAKELAGYLMVIPLTPEETRSLILPDLNDVLTGKDVKVLFDQLELDALYDEAASQALIEEDQPLTRVQWTTIYELMLDKLGMKGQVSEAEIQYLGDVSGEDRIIADSGNYDCDPESCVFSYGKVYTVYLSGNTILGRKDTQETEPDRDDAEQPADDEAQTASVTVPETVRVLITQDNGQSPYRPDLRVKCPAGMTVTSGEQSVTLGSNEVAACVDLMNTWGTNALTLQPSEGGQLYLTDAGGTKDSAAYRGSFRVYRNESGCWLVNELSMEEYLYGVVPGEMPESFAAEAQMAQAVCARTYACRQIAGKSYEAYGADLNDTTDCQVYLPAKENPSAVSAVDATKGQVLLYDGDFAQIYYFSTSCGYTSGLEVWRQDPVSYLGKVSLLTENNWKWKFENFIKDQDIAAYDSHSRYFRWTAEVDPSGRSDALRGMIQKYADDPGGRLSVQDASGNTLTDCSFLGACQNMEVKDRSKSGTVTDLCLQFENGSVHIYNENTIRTVLGAALSSMKDKNGNIVNDMNMLPSAAFAIEGGENGSYTIYGGGLGHGIGMSQYGADGMANAGMSYRDILDKFFPGTSLSE